MSQPETPDAVAFFTAMRQGFGRMLAAPGGDPIERVAEWAFELFDRNAAAQEAALPDLDCHKGCAPCCILRVTATAPELFLLARYIRRIHATPEGAALDLPGRIAEADRVTRGLSEAERMAKRTACPVALKAICIVHSVRPLACRGHASFDRRACAQAAAGRDVEVPISAAHATIRMLVQNAMQAALRESGRAWEAYELIGALNMILRDASLERQWLDGADVLAPVRAGEVDWLALAASFDAMPA